MTRRSWSACAGGAATKTKKLRSRRASRSGPRQRRDGGRGVGAQARGRLAEARDLLEVFFDADGAVRTVQSLFADFGKNFKSRFDLEASLAALHRKAFLWPVKDKRWAEYDSPAWAAPSELVECVRGYRERRQRQLPDAHLAGLPGGALLQAQEGQGKPTREGAKAADHARKIYKLYAEARCSSAWQAGSARARAGGRHAARRRGQL